MKNYMHTKKQIIRRFSDGLEGVTLIKELSNKAKINRSAGYMDMQCPVCGIMFSRKASEINRHENSYCGRGCAGYACRRQQEVECRACGRKFTVRKSLVGHITCCSEKCKRIVLSETTRAWDLNSWARGLFKTGQDHPAAKLKAMDIKQILADGRSHQKIANDYGVTKARIGQIKRANARKEAR